MKLTYMIAVLTGDVVESQSQRSHETWSEALRTALSLYGLANLHWEVFRGDSFQLKLEDPLEAFSATVIIRSALRAVDSRLDARVGIGIGPDENPGTGIDIQFGEAFVRSGRKFEQLKAEKTLLNLHSPWPDWDDSMNLHFRLASFIMHHWSVNSAAIVFASWSDDRTQQELAEELGIGQSSVSRRQTRAALAELRALDSRFRTTLSSHV